MYTQGWYHVLRRYDRTTGQVDRALSADVRGPLRRRTAAGFLAQGSRTLYMAAQHVLASTDRGLTWRTISPDLAAPAGRTAAGAAPAERQAASARRRRADRSRRSRSSPVSASVIWAGTSTGLIHVTRDGGKTWTNVTPPSLPPAGINVIDASHANAGTAYAALLSRDAHPHIYRTSDYGATGRRSRPGSTDGEIVRVVREDPVDPTLLYAGTVTSVWVSFDRGDHWQSLQLNLPATVVSDLTVHENDLVASTYGRGFWILDDVSPLRQIRAAMAANAPAFFFKPAPASRARWDNTQDTPLPPEMKAGDNPPEGAILDYYLAAPASGSITLTIADARRPRHPRVLERGAAAGYDDGQRSRSTGWRHRWCCRRRPACTASPGICGIRIRRR